MTISNNVFKMKNPGKVLSQIGYMSHKYKLDYGGVSEKPNEEVFLQWHGN